MVKNAILMAFSGLTLQALSVGFQAYLSARVGAEGMGILNLVLTVGGLAATLASSGVRVAAMQLVARAHGHRDPDGVFSATRSCLRRALAVSAAVGLLLALLARPLAEGILKDGRTAPALRTLGVLLPFGCLCGVLGAWLTATGRVKRLVTVELLERFFSIGLTLMLLLWAGSDLTRVCCGVVAGSFGGAMLSTCLLYLRYRRERRRGARRLRSMGRQVRRLCLPLAANDYLRSGLNALEQFLIPYGLGRSASRSAGLAAYGTISGMVFPVIKFPGAILYAVSDLMVPEMARCLATKNRARMRALTRKCMAGTAIFAGTVNLLLFCFGRRIGLLFFHSRTAGDLIRLFSPMVLFLFLDAIVDGLQKGLGQQVYLVRYNSFTNLLDVIFLYTLLPRFGIPGFVFTYVFTHLVNLFLSLRRLLIAIDGASTRSDTPRR